MAERIPSREDYITAFDTRARERVDHVMRENPSQLPALMVQLETERRWVELVLYMRDTIYNFADIIDAELSKWRQT